MSAKLPGQIFSEPKNDRQIMASWERFMSSGETQSNALRRLIDDSWRRCQNASVDPGRYQAAPPVVDDVFDSLRHICSDLLEASVPVMASARDFLSETGTVMVLTDPGGTLLNLEGDTSLRGAAENIHLLPGANWSEVACGTNAIGTAIEVGQPVQIHSAEHYCSGIKRWTCSASVVRDPYDNSILGVVDVSGLTESYSRQSLALVVATAGRIETRLAGLEMDIRYRLLEHCMDRLGSTRTDGIIVFDRHGRAIKANGPITEMLSEKNGHRVDDLMSVRFDWKNGQEIPTDLPAWIRREWLEPVTVNGQRLGAVLVLPNQKIEKSSNRIYARGEPAYPHDTNSRKGFERLIGEADGLQHAIIRGQQVAKSQVPVLLLGETGVGKDVFARCLHDTSVAKEAPFIAINCGSFSRELLSSELFGYADGAFTGARRGGMIGKIEAANGGTLFLDEIGEMPLDLQPHLLRVLDSGEVYRIGETKPRKANFRLLSATNRDLRKEIQAGTFRMDLFYRLAVVSITLPALRDRKGDLPLLADHFIKQLATRHGVPPRHLTPGLLKLLSQYDWPGNIREFRNVMESMLLVSQGAMLTEADAPADLWATQTAQMNGVTVGIEAVPGQRPSDLSPLELVERQTILRAVKVCRGNLTAVARDLGIAKSTVYVKLKRFGLDAVVESFRNDQI